RPTRELPAEGDRLGVDAVRPADAERVSMLVCPGDYGGECAVDPPEGETPGVLDLQRERRVDDIRRRQAEVQTAPFGTERVGDGVDEGGSVVIGFGLQLGDARRRRHSDLRADLPEVVGRNRADLRPTLERSELDVEPARELALLRPDPGHGRAG